MTSPSPAPLTPVEQAAASEVQNFCSHTGPSTDPASLCGECDKVARAVVAAVRGPIAAKALIDAAERVLDQADRVRVKFGSVQPSGWNRTYGLSEAASMLRADAQSLSLPASKETQQ